MTTQRHDAKADAAHVDLAEAERAANLWLALAIRNLARDPAVLLAAIRSVTAHRITDLDMTPEDSVAAALRGVADHLEGA